MSQTLQCNLATKLAKNTITSQTIKIEKKYTNAAE